MHGSIAAALPAPLLATTIRWGSIWPLLVTALAIMGACDMVSVYVRETLIQLWTPDEVQKILDAKEFSVARSYWGLDRAAKFEGKHWHLRVARPLDWFRTATAPFTLGLAAVSNSILRLLGIRPAELEEKQGATPSRSGGGPLGRAMSWWQAKS